MSRENRLEDLKAKYNALSALLVEDTDSEGCFGCLWGSIDLEGFPCSNCDRGDGRGILNICFWVPNTLVWTDALEQIAKDSDDPRARAIAEQALKELEEEEDDEEEENGEVEGTW